MIFNWIVSELKKKFHDVKKKQTKQAFSLHTNVQSYCLFSVSVTDQCPRVTSFPGGRFIQLSPDLKAL